MGPSLDLIVPRPTRDLRDLGLGPCPSVSPRRGEPPFSPTQKGSFFFIAFRSLWPSLVASWPLAFGLHGEVVLGLISKWPLAFIDSGLWALLVVAFGPPFC